jgi:hypothetical protein
MSSTPEVFTPSEIIIDMADAEGEDKANRALYYTDDLETALPGLPEAFRAADHWFEDNKLNHLLSLEDSLFTLDMDGEPVICSLRYSAASALSKAINVTSHGFADYSPKSSAVELRKYIDIEDPSIPDKQKAMPNTWSAITKAATMHDIRQAMGLGMPQLDIYRPTHDRFTGGQFAYFADTVEAAVAHAQEALHGKTSETQISELHLNGLSFGASEVVGAAAEIKLASDQLDVRSVTAQEIIMGLSFPELIKFGGLVGEPSAQTSIGEGSETILEPMLRQQGDKYGNEPTMTFRR